MHLSFFPSMYFFLGGGYVNLLHRLLTAFPTWKQCSSFYPLMGRFVTSSCNVVTTFQEDVVETYHWDVLATFHGDIIECFIWDLAATYSKTLLQRCYHILLPVRNIVLNRHLKKKTQWLENILKITQNNWSLQEKWKHFLLCDKLLGCINHHQLLTEYHLHNFFAF